MLAASRRFLPISEPSIGPREIEYVTDAVRSGWVSSLGKYIDQFEAQFASYCGTRFAVSVSNGTTGLHLALLSYGIGPGDEVIVPDFTFVATASAVRHCGATPVFVDVDPETLCISTSAAAAAVTSRTRAIIPVHIYGHPANIPELLRLVSGRNIVVIEDAAEAHGAEVLGKRVGGLGHCGVFSFYGNKIITTGEGGMITSDDETLSKKARMLRDHAMQHDRRYWHTEVGYNYRITNLQAALGVAQLERIDEIVAKKLSIFEAYQSLLGSLPRARLNRTARWAKNVYWMVCLELEGLTEAARELLMQRMKLEGIDSRPYFYPVSDMPMYERAATPVTHELYARGINIPSFFAMNPEDIERVATVIRKLV